MFRIATIGSPNFQCNVRKMTLTTASTPRVRHASYFAWHQNILASQSSGILLTQSATHSMSFPQLQRQKTTVHALISSQCHNDGSMRRVAPRSGGHGDLFRSPHRLVETSSCQLQYRCIRIPKAPSAVNSSNSSSSNSSFPSHMNSKNNDEKNKNNNNNAGTFSSSTPLSSSNDSQSRPLSSPSSSPPQAQQGNNLKRTPNSTTSDAFILSIAAAGAFIILKGASLPIQFVREVAISHPIAGFCFAVFFGLMGFVIATAWVVVNERRHAVQNALRSRAKRRCVDIHDSDELESELLRGKHAKKNGKNKCEENEILSPVVETASSKSKSTLLSLDRVVRVSGAIALDAGQFRNANDSPPSAAAATATREKAPVVMDKVIGIPFDVAPSHDAKSITADEHRLQDRIASLSSKDFLEFIVTGGKGSREDSPSSSSSSTAMGSRVLALKRTVEVYQFTESYDYTTEKLNGAATMMGGTDSSNNNNSNNMTEKKSQKVYRYHAGWSQKQERFENPASYRVVVGTTLSDTDTATGKTVKKEGFIPFVFKAFNDNTIVPFPYPQISFQGGREGAVVPTTTTQHPNLNVNSNSAQYQSICNASRNYAPSSSSSSNASGGGLFSLSSEAEPPRVDQLTLGETFLIPTNGFVRLWLRPPRENASKITENDDSRSPLTNAAESDSPSSDPSSPCALPISSPAPFCALQTIAFDSSILAKQMPNSWRRLNFNTDLSPEGRSLLNQQLSGTNSSSSFLTISTRYHKPVEDAFWLFKSHAKYISERSGLGGLFGSSTNGSQSAAGSTFTNLLEQVLAADTASNKNNQIAGDLKNKDDKSFDSFPTVFPSPNVQQHGSLKRAFDSLKTIQQKEYEAEMKRAQEEAKRIKSNSDPLSASSPQHMYNTVTVNWSSPTPSSEVLRIPSEQLRISSCGNYLTTVRPENENHLGERSEHDDDGKKEERQPRIGDVRIRYEYVPVTTLTVIGHLSDTPQRQGAGTCISHSSLNSLNEVNQRHAIDSQLLQAGETTISSDSCKSSPTLFMTRRGLQRFLTSMVLRKQQTIMERNGQQLNNGNTFIVVPHHLPYNIEPWTFDSYLNELGRLGKLRDNSKDSYRLSHDESAMPSTAVGTMKWIGQRAKERVVTSIHEPFKASCDKDDRDDLRREEREEIESLINQLLDSVGTLGGSNGILTPIIPRWALEMCEKSLHEEAPIEVICTSSRENASSTYLFRKHWYRDECTTLSQRYCAFLLMQMSLAAATSVLVPLPASMLGVGVTGVAAAVWLQSIIMAKSDMRKKASDSTRHELRD